MNGFRSHRVGDYRVILRICKDCRERGFDGWISCMDCNTMDDETIKLFIADKRPKIYDRLDRLVKQL